MDDSIMGELDRIHATMQDNFKEIFSKLDKLEEGQAFHKKDIEYLQKTIEEKKLNTKENKKTLVAIITSALALIGTLFNIFLG